LASPRERWMAVLIHTAAVWLGVPGWAVSAAYAGSWNFFPMFDIGLFMVAGGFLAALAGYLAPAGFVRQQAPHALQFHGAGMLVAAALGLAFLMATLFDPTNPTMSSPPAHMEAVLFVGAFVFGFLAPIVVLIWVPVSAVRSWKRGKRE
jgi:hypothetical protein